jgi:hypothetical protein
MPKPVFPATAFQTYLPPPLTPPVIDNIIREIILTLRFCLPSLPRRCLSHKFDELDAGVWDPKRALNDGEVQFAAGSSNSLRIYDTRRDFPDYSSGGAAVRALGTTTPQAHPSLGVHFRKGAVPNVAVAAVFLVDGRPAPVTWVLEAFRGGRIVGRWRPERLITSLRASTGVVAVDEVRILGTNAPADGSGLILLTDLSYDSADIKTEEVARRE